MESVLSQRNKDLIANRFPVLSNRLDSTPGENSGIELFPSRTGRMTCRARTPTGRWVTLHSTVDPEGESIRFIRQVEHVTEGIIILLGTGLGYPLLALLSQKGGEGRTIIAVEEDLSLFRRAMGCLDLKALAKMEDSLLLIGENVEEVLKAVTRFRMKKGFQKLVILSHGPSIRRNPDFYGPLQRELRLLEKSPLESRLIYPKLTKETLTVLVLESEYFLTKECLRTLQALGHRVVPISFSTDRFVETLLTHITRERPDFLLSINHLGFDEEGKLTQLLESMRLPFAVWYVDSPTFIIQNFKKNVSPYCVLFIWDRTYMKPMDRCGFQRIHFLPLATDPSIFRPMKSSRIPRRFRSRISFVGNSMVEAADHWFRQLPQDPDLEAVTRLAIPLQMQNHRMPMAEVLETIARDQGLRIDFADPADNVNFQAALVWKATLEYRKNLVEGLRTFGIRVYGDMGWHRIVNGDVKIRAPVSYYRELPMVFNGTDLNINATSFQMTTAVNQRVFDSAACGAFLVTDHQADMDILFDPKSEAVCYGDLGQARDQVAYYLNHETERRRIADKARKRVISEHTYAHRLQRMIRILKNEFESS